MAARGKRKAKGKPSNPSQCTNLSDHLPTATSPEKKSKRVSATGVSSDASNSEYAGEEDVGRDESEYVPFQLTKLSYPSCVFQQHGCKLFFLRDALHLALSAVVNIFRS